MAVSSGARLKWISDLDKSVLVSNFEKRGWVKGSFEGQCLPYTLPTIFNITFADGEWNFYW